MLTRTALIAIASGTMAMTANLSLAQQAEPPSWRRYCSARTDYRFENPSEYGWLRTGSRATADSGKVMWLRTDEGLTNPDEDLGEIAVSIHYPGNFCPGLASNRVLLCGLNQDGTHGRVVHLELRRTAPKGLFLLDDVDLGAGRDPIELVWNPARSRLLVIDRRNREMLVGDWTGVDSLPGVFQVAFGSTSGPFLDGTDNWWMSVDEQGHVFVWEKLGARFYELDEIAGQWSIQSHSIGSAPVHLVHLEDPLTANARWPIQVYGPATAFDVVDLDTGTVVTTTSLAAAETWTAISHATPMVPGHIHALVLPNGESERFLPLARWGAPSTAGGLQADRGLISWGDHCVGNPKFSAGATIRALSPPASFSFASDVSLFVAAAAPGDPPPVLEMQGVALLVPADIVGPTTYPITTGEPTTTVGQEYPIPDDPALAGVRVYLQFAGTAPDNGVILSDVFAVDLLSAEQALASRGSRRFAPTAGTEESRRKAAARWMSGRLSDGEAAAHAQLRERLGRR